MGVGAALDELARELGTDKSSRGHGYTRVYARLLPDRERVEKIAEIGVFEGASLRLWEAWCPRATVYGVDPQRDCRYEPPPGSRIVILRKDQGVRADLLDVARELGRRAVDAIIDDGSHFSEHQLLAFQHLWPCVKPGGFYAIEDLHCSYDPLFTRGLTLRVTEWLKELIDVVNWNGRGGGAPSEQKVPSSELPLLEQEIESVQVWKSLAVIVKRERARR